MSPVNDCFLLDRRAWLKGAGLSLASALHGFLGLPCIHGKSPRSVGFHVYAPMGSSWISFGRKTGASTHPAHSQIPATGHGAVSHDEGHFGCSDSPFNGAPHALELSTWLTARLPDPSSRGRINISISADQIMATHVGAQTALLARAGHHAANLKENQEGLHEGYYNHCSYRSPTQPVPAEIDPTY